MHLALPDYLIIALYFVVVLSVGFMIKFKIKTSNDFLMSSRSVPLWITSLAFISANLGAQEVIGMAASGAKYGIMTSHFYWLGGHTGYGFSRHFYDALLLW
jgi:SSS family solute:Na+ symporter